MMAEFPMVTRKDASFSEVAVDGLFAGLLAGLLMAVYLTITAFIRSEALGVLFSRFHPTQSASPWTGFLLHLAVSGVYGILFGCIYYLAIRLPRSVTSLWQGIALGAGYGAFLFLIAWFVLLPASASPLRQLPLWQFGSAHLVYGLILGWRIGRI